MLIMLLMILILLVVPIYVLYELTNTDDSPRTNMVCIGVMLVFTLSFSACISLFTSKSANAELGKERKLTRPVAGARRHEILAASAA